MTYNLENVNYHKKYMDEDMNPLFPFGHGLSYTSFEYTNLTLDTTDIKMNGKGEVRVSIEVENVGSVEGEEVVQLYVKDLVASIARPNKELKGYKRINLKSGEKKKLEFILYTDQLAFHDRKMKLVVEPGMYSVMLGSSSEDIRLNGEFEVKWNGYEVDSYEVEGIERKYFSKIVVSSPV